MRCWNVLTTKRKIRGGSPDIVATRPVGEALRNWGYTVADEAEGSDTNGVVFTRAAWTDLPEA